MRGVLSMLVLAVMFFASVDGLCQPAKMPPSADDKMTGDSDPPITGLPFNHDPMTIYVPSDYPSIQRAINASVNGDVIIVNPGTYVENINFKGKAIIVMSSGGPLVTTIDGGSPMDPKKGSVVTFESGEDDLSVISGFSIVNGTGTFRPPQGTHCGAGVFCYYSSPTITNNMIMHNNAEDLMKHASSKENPSHPSHGFKMGFEPAASNGSETLTRDNTGVGGGIGCYESSAFITNNLISNNYGVKGGGIACSVCTLTLSNNTIVDNTAESGGGLYASGYSNLTITDSIFWNNQAPEGMEWSLLTHTTVNASYCDFEGGMASVAIGPNSVIDWGAGIIDSDPFFTSGVLCDYYLSHDLYEYSPCIDTGSGLVTDLGYDTSWTCIGKIPDTGVVDMGYHFGPHEPQTHTR